MFDMTVVSVGAFFIGAFLLGSFVKFFILDTIIKNLEDSVRILSRIEEKMGKLAEITNKLDALKSDVPSHKDGNFSQEIHSDLSELVVNVESIKEQMRWYVDGTFANEMIKSIKNIDRSEK